MANRRFLCQIGFPRMGAKVVREWRATHPRRAGVGGLSPPCDAVGEGP
jgi:hypothetical protein